MRHLIPTEKEQLLPVTFSAMFCPMTPGPRLLRGRHASRVEVKESESWRTHGSEQPRVSWARSQGNEAVNEAGRCVLQADGLQPYLQACGLVVRDSWLLPGPEQNEDGGGEPQGTAVVCP